ncbi:hypothetical protein GCM10027174_31710 [Salinifilum aidingensis]
MPGSRGASASTMTNMQSPAKDENYDLLTVLQLSLQHVCMFESCIEDARREGDRAGRVVEADPGEQPQGRHGSARTPRTALAAFAERVACARAHVPAAPAHPGWVSPPTGAKTSPV